MRYTQNPTANDLKEFVNQFSWSKQMERSNGLDSFSNYSGPDLGDLVVVCGRNRDSELIAESNFECALKELGGESETVRVERFGHWGCGWFELILVDPKDTKALETAYSIKRCLQEYVLLDDSDFSEREFEQQLEDFDTCHGYFERNFAEALGLENDDLEGNREDLETLLRAAFQDDVSYRGVEDAFVNEDSLGRFAKSWECDRLAKDGNEYAQFLMIVCNVQPRLT